MTTSYFNLIIVLIPFLLEIFWLWMFLDMTNNQDLPECFIRIGKVPNPKTDWAFAFVFMNIVAALFYWWEIYRKK